jgi:hypothetical protein
MGGAALVERGKLVHNIGKRGVEAAGLERRCWMQFVGKNNKSTRIVSYYAPHQPTLPAYVGSQHKRYYNSIGCDSNHVDAFWADLSRLVRKCGSPSGLECGCQRGENSEIHGRSRYEEGNHAISWR